MQNPDDLFLDNVVWHALRGPLSEFVSTESTAELVHFDREVSLFSGVEYAGESVWHQIAELIGVGRNCCLFRDSLPAAPIGWEEQFRGSCLQMVAGDPLAAVLGLKAVRLGPEDVSEMLSLTSLTEPGPFLPRTVELGRYVGIRREGVLVAMAGERLRVPGFVEISGVCTHPDVRGEGLGGELTLNVVQSIRAGGDEAFLHVLESNENAIRLYRKLGFVVRRTVDVVFAEWHGPDWRPVDPEIS